MAILDVLLDVGILGHRMCGFVVLREKSGKNSVKSLDIRISYLVNIEKHYTEEKKNGRYL